MSKQFFFPALLFLVFCSACEKSDEISKNPIFWGEATALQNGKPWRADPFARKNLFKPERMDIKMDSLLGGVRIVEALNLSNVPLKPGTYSVRKGDRTVPFSEQQDAWATFGLTNQDVIYAIYHVWESDSRSNFVTVISVDSVKGGEVRGTFDLTFVVWRKAFSYMPDTVRFRNGRFHTRFID